MTKKIPLTMVPVETDCNYPLSFDRPCLDQSTQRLARHAGLTQFGVNLTVIQPGVWSSQRHWHSHEDELVWVLEGELTLLTDVGDEVLRAGDCAAFRRGDPDGHHFINKTSRPARYSKSVPTIRRIAACIQTLTWSPNRARRATVTAMALPTR